MPSPRRLLTALACVFALALPTATAFGADDPKTLDRIVAVVNDGVVLASELEAEVARTRERLQRNDQRVPPDAVLRERLLEQLIVREIQLQRAARAGIEVDDASVNNALRNMADQYNTDLAGLRDRLAAEGVQFDRLRADVREQLIASRLRQREVASQVQVSEEEVDQALERMEQASDRQTEYQLRHLMIAVPADASPERIESAQADARDLVRRLRDGAEFGRLATRVSDGPEALSGGDLGWRSSTSLPGLFLEALREMSPGAISSPIRSPNGFHILKLIDRRGGQSQTVTEIRARHILLREGESEGDEAADSAGGNPRRRLAELRQRLEAGASFAELARTHSDDQASASSGGDLGWIGPGEMTPAFQQVIESLPPGSISEPFRTPYGWHLAKVIDKREREDVGEYRRAQARRSLYEREVEQATQRWLQRLRDQAYVEVRLSE